MITKVCSVCSLAKSSEDVYKHKTIKNYFTKLYNIWKHMKINREKQLKDNNQAWVVGGLMHRNPDDFEQLTHCVCEWARQRNITAEGGATSYTQIPKLIEEVYEFRDATTEEEAKLEFGDILVVCIQIARLRGLDMVECLDLAYNKIKDRKGRMIDGRFVKEV